jgi:hypothetical protein
MDLQVHDRVEVVADDLPFGHELIHRSSAIPKRAASRPFFFPMSKLSRLAFALLTLTLLALGWWAYAPGLGGSFLFDDYVNLTALGEYGGVRDAHTLSLYLTSGLGDLTGRPLSLLSFLIDANNWPALPTPFLRTNILLHLFNGALLIAVLYRLGVARRLSVRHAQLAGLIGAGIWLLHPLMLSTVLYIVQREAMLPATFVLAGILLWLAGRQRLRSDTPSWGYALCIAGSIGCTALATLCKANGVLLPLLLLVIEATVFSGAPASARFLRLRSILLGLPIAAVAIVLIVSIPEWATGASSNRPWTLAQRALTEPRVLLEYLHLLVLPQPIGGGIFHDNFVASTDWLHPASTLLAFAGVIAAIAGAWFMRRRWPIVACAVLFYFAGQVLESTIVPLELYFEHRNYLPAMLAFWPLAVWLSAPNGRLARLRLCAAAVILGALAVDTHTGANLWGQPEKLALAWAERNPDSPRAQAYAAQMDVAHARPRAAETRLTGALAAHPEQSQLAFNLAGAQCTLGALPATTAAAVRYAVLHDVAAARLDFAWLQDAVARAKSGTCKGLDLAMVDSFIQAARDNRAFADASGRTQDFDHLQGLVALAEHKDDAALAYFDSAASVLPRPEIALTQAALLGQNGRPDLGLRHLDRFLADHPLQPAHFGLAPSRLHAWLLDRSGYWSDEFARVRGLLAREQRAPDNPGHTAANPPTPNER